MAEIEGLVRALREGDDAAKEAAARALRNLACYPKFKCHRAKTSS